MRWTLGDKVTFDLQVWASGPTAMETFGGDADALDALCLMAAYAREIPYALWCQVQAAQGDGASWAAIAAALGVSRQAAKKRYGEDPPWLLRP